MADATVRHVVRDAAREAVAALDVLRKHLDDDAIAHAAEVDLLRAEVARLKAEVQEWKVKAIGEKHEERRRVVSHLRLGGDGGKLWAESIERGEHEG